MKSVHVNAPSRLHFGLMNFGGAERQYGGVGVMVNCNGPYLRLHPAKHFCVRENRHAARIERFARQWQTFHRYPELPCELCLINEPDEHVGLGLGTQLGMSVAAGLSAFFKLPPQTPQELAISVGRGKRSAVGTYGFALGGLIVERGKLPGELISPLDCHLDLPPEWGVFLACPRGRAGLANLDEARAFKQLPKVPTSVTDELVRIVREEIVPAAAQADFDAFSDAVYRYGRMSGECFAPLQGGPYNGPQATAIVEQFRSLGLKGVGQSSWGPTIFAFTRSSAEAEHLKEAVFKAFRPLEPEGIDCGYCNINNEGARIEVSEGVNLVE